MDECQRTAERLTSYVDEMLPAGERKEVERHLNACPPCRRDAEQEQGGRTVLRECADRLKSQPLPPGLRSRCETLAREGSRKHRLMSWRLVVPATAMAVLVIFAGVLLFSLATRRSDAVLAAQLTADHVKCFKVFVPNDGQPETAVHVEEELESNYGWDMHVPPSSSDAGVTLVGGRRCLYADGSMPHVMYRAAAGPVSLYRLEGVTRKDNDLTSLGHRCRIWARGGHTYVLVTPERSTPEMARIARYVQQEAR